MRSHSDPSASRARARSTRAETDERILEIAEAMGAGAWGPKSEAEWAARWGLSESTVANMATEASRLARMLERQHARLRIARALDKGLELAEGGLADADGGRCPECGRADLDILRALPAVADRYAKLTGADDAKPETTINVAVQVVASIRALPGPERFEALRELATLALEELPPLRRERARALLTEAFVASDDPEVAT